MDRRRKGESNMPRFNFVEQWVLLVTPPFADTDTGIYTQTSPQYHVPPEKQAWYCGIMVVWNSLASHWHTRQDRISILVRTSTKMRHWTFHLNRVLNRVLKHQALCKLFNYITYNCHYTSMQNWKIGRRSCQQWNIHRFNSLRPSDAYMCWWPNHHWFR